jgi:anti-sigma B factor antagonist
MSLVDQSLGVSITPHDDKVVLAVAGELDFASAPGLSEAIGDLRATGWQSIVIDIRAVTFMDSAGLITLLSADGAACRGGWEVQLAGPCAPLDRVLDAARIAGVGKSAGEGAPPSRIADK